MLRRPDDLNLDGDNPKDDDDEDENVDGSEDPFDIDSQLKETEEEDQKGEDDSADKKQEEEEMGNPTEEEENPCDDEKGEEENGSKDFEMEEMEPPAEKTDGEQPLNEPEKAVASTDEPSKTEAQPATEEAVKGSGLILFSKIVEYAIYFENYYYFKKGHKTKRHDRNKLPIQNQKKVKMARIKRRKMKRLKASEWRNHAKPVVTKVSASRALIVKH